MSQRQNGIAGGNGFPEPMISGVTASVNGLMLLHLKIAVRQGSPVGRHAPVCRCLAELFPAVHIEHKPGMRLFSGQRLHEQTDDGVVGEQFTCFTEEGGLAAVVVDQHAEIASMRIEVVLHFQNIGIFGIEQVAFVLRDVDPGELAGEFFEQVIKGFPDQSEGAGDGDFERPQCVEVFEKLAAIRLHGMESALRAGLPGSTTVATFGNGLNFFQLKSTRDRLSLFQ